MNLKKSLVVATMFAIAAAFADGAASVESVTVATKAPHNQEATFWYHVHANYDAKAIAREWLMAALAGGESWIWGEDDTMLVKERDDIEPESRNPLYTRRLSELWQR